MAQQMLLVGADEAHSAQHMLQIFECSPEAHAAQGMFVSALPTNMAPGAQHMQHTARSSVLS